MMPLINGVTDPIIVVGTRGDTSATKVQNLNRVTEVLTVQDTDTRHLTLTAENIKGGINVHTSVTGGGTVTVDTAANIIAKVPLTEDDQCIVSYYVNDGDQTCTFAADSGGTVTLADIGNTVLINEAATLVWRRTSATAVTMYMVSS
jgi:hypothetical protein